MKIIENSWNIYEDHWKIHETWMKIIENSWNIDEDHWKIHETLMKIIEKFMKHWFVILLHPWNNRNNMYVLFRYQEFTRVYCIKYGD